MCYTKPKKVFGKKWQKWLAKSVRKIFKSLSIICKIFAHNSTNPSHMVQKWLQRVGHIISAVQGNVLLHNRINQYDSTKEFVPL